MEPRIEFELLSQICSILALFGLANCFMCIADVGIYIGKKIHCHRVMKKGKEHKCHYWTCENYSRCPYNITRECKLPKYITKNMDEN